MGPWDQGSPPLSRRHAVTARRSVVKKCPGCSYLVPAGWDECRRCGASLRDVALAGPLVAAAPSAPPPFQTVLVPARPPWPPLGKRTRSLPTPWPPWKNRVGYAVCAVAALFAI